MPTLPDGAIRADEVWKRFRADRRRKLLRDQVERVADRFRGRLDRCWRWALREVTLHADPGESVGLVGANGSGKSTFLKLLTRVMYPTAGSIRVAGRVGALIEVRAGIHPDLTGRENVLLYGSLLGVGRPEVLRRFDEIVAFAELDRAIDRQVKFYSTGMQMRLGFAVAAFLEPDLLLVDEVLAVGDASFQQRCLDRMRHVLAQGTTLIFVSHDLPAIEATCTRGLWLHEGDLLADGPIRDVVNQYRQMVEAGAESVPRIDGPVRLLKASVSGPDASALRTGAPLEITLVTEADRSYGTRVYFGVSEGTATPIFLVSKWVDIIPGQTEMRCTTDPIPLPRGRFFLWAAILEGGDDGVEVLAWQPVSHFDLAGPELDPPPRAVVRLAPVWLGSEWEIDRR